MESTNTDGDKLSAVGIQALTDIGSIVDEETRLQLRLVQHVARARIAGASWRMIGVALGTSTQAAWMRFRPAEDRPPVPGQGALFTD